MNNKSIKLIDESLGMINNLEQKALLNLTYAFSKTLNGHQEIDAIKVLYEHYVGLIHHKVSGYEMFGNIEDLKDDQNDIWLNISDTEGICVLVNSI